MSGLRSTLSALAFAGLLATVPLRGAFALEADDVAESLRALFAHQGVEAEWSGIEEDGSAITLKALTLEPKDGGGSVSLGDVTMEAVSEEDDHYRVGEVTLPAYEQTLQDGVTAHIEGMDIEGLVLPKDIDADPLGGAARYDKAEIAEATVTKGEKQLFALEDFSVQMMQPEDGGGTLEMHGSAKSFTLALADVVGPKMQAVLDELGYAQLAGELEMAGSWRPSDGRLMLSQGELDIADAGTFGLTMDISGYTTEFMEGMRQIGEKMKSASDDQKAAQSFAMIGLAQQLNFHGAMLRFDDDSLTGKILDYLADRQGVTPDDVAGQAEALIQLKLAPYLGQELTGEVSAAIDTFLDDPQSLELRADPGKAVPFAMIMGAAMSSPEAVRDQLGVDIIANGEGR